MRLLWPTQTVRLNAAKLIRPIDSQQDWVGAMCDSNICKLWKVDMKENESDLLTKIHKADQFERLRDRCMVFRQIPKGQPADTDCVRVQVRSAGG